MRFGSSQLAPEFNPFEDEYIGEILTAVALAWARMKAPKWSEIENQITNRLAGILISDVPFRNLPFEVVPQYPLLNIDGKILGQLDLRIKYPQSQRDYFAFEAKRLHVTSVGGVFRQEYREYIGDPGMGAFIEGQYSKGLPAAGMLGYVMDGDTGKAWQGLVKSIESKRNDLRLITNGALVESAMRSFIEGAASGTKLGESLHDLITHRLRIHHLLLSA